MMWRFMLIILLLGVVWMSPASPSTDAFAVSPTQSEAKPVCPITPYIISTKQTGIGQLDVRFLINGPLSDNISSEIRINDQLVKARNDTTKPASQGQVILVLDGSSEFDFEDVRAPYSNMVRSFDPDIEVGLIIFGQSNLLVVPPSSNSRDIATSQINEYEAPPRLAEVMVPGLHVRSAPQLDANIVARLEQGDQVPVFDISDDGEWLYIRTPNNEEGWSKMEQNTVLLQLIPSVARTTPAEAVARAIELLDQENDTAQAIFLATNSAFDPAQAAPTNSPDNILLFVIGFDTEDHPLVNYSAAAICSTGEGLIPQTYEESLTLTGLSVAMAEFRRYFQDQVIFPIDASGYTTNELEIEISTGTAVARRSMAFDTTQYLITLEPETALLTNTPGEKVQIPVTVDPSPPDNSTIELRRYAQSSEFGSTEVDWLYILEQPYVPDIDLQLDTSQFPPGEYILSANLVLPDGQEIGRGGSPTLVNFYRELPVEVDEVSPGRAADNPDITIDGTFITAHIAPEDDQIIPLYLLIRNINTLPQANSLIFSLLVDQVQEYPVQETQTENSYIAVLDLNDLIDTDQDQKTITIEAVFRDTGDVVYAMGHLNLTLIADRTPRETPKVQFINLPNQLMDNGLDTDLIIQVKTGPLEPDDVLVFGINDNPVTCTELETQQLEWSCPAQAFLPGQLLLEVYQRRPDDDDNIETIAYDSHTLNLYRDFPLQLVGHEDPTVPAKFSYTLTDAKPLNLVANLSKIPLTEQNTSRQFIRLYADNSQFQTMEIPRNGEDQELLILDPTDFWKIEGKRTVHFEAIVVDTANIQYGYGELEITLIAEKPWCGDYCQEADIAPFIIGSTVLLIGLIIIIRRRGKGNGYNELDIDWMLIVQNSESPVERWALTKPHYTFGRPAEHAAEANIPIKNAAVSRGIHGELIYRAELGGWEYSELPPQNPRGQKNYAQISDGHSWKQAQGEILRDQAELVIEAGEYRVILKLEHG